MKSLDGPALQLQFRLRDGKAPMSCKWLNSQDYLPDELGAVTSPEGRPVEVVTGVRSNEDRRAKRRPKG
jgi:hypothetical protein